MKHRILLFSILAALVIAWLAWSYAVPHTTLSEGPLNYSEAQANSPIPLPASATNIRIATYRHWTQSTTFIRFDAPLADCQALAQQLLPNVSPEVIRVAGTQPADFPPPGTSEHFTAQQLQWFAANRVATGERRTAPGGQTSITLAIPLTHTSGPVPPTTFYYRDGD